jgi:hypothetical protein
MKDVHVLAFDGLAEGPSFFIEKSKRRMIAEDIAAALKLRELGIR